MTAAQLPTPHDELLERAAALRQLARRLDGVSAMELHRRADRDVWIGPTPTRCHEELLGIRRSLHTAAENLRAAARLLEHRTESPGR